MWHQRLQTLPISRRRKRLLANLWNDHAPARTRLAEPWPRRARGGLEDEEERAETKVFGRGVLISCFSTSFMLLERLFISRGKMYCR